MMNGVISISTLIKSALVCFEENTQVTKEDGSNISIVQIFEGDKIMSITNDFKFYDEVTSCTVLEGKFAAKKFVFSNGKFITVTSTHLMLILNGNHLELTPANDIKLHDVMCFEDGFSKITNIFEITLDKKVHVNTKSGLLYANGLLTTGICENLPKNLPAPAKVVVKKHMLNYLMTNLDFPHSIIYDDECQRLRFTHEIVSKSNVKK